MNAEPSRILWASAVVVCCLAVGVAGGTTIDPARTTSIETSAGVESKLSDEASLQQLQQSNANTSKTTLRIDTHANGSAVWTVQYRLHLDNANETTAFDQLRTAITSNPAQYRDRFGQRMAGAVASAENATGREMVVENVSVRAARNGTTGTVTYEFVWRNFAATAGDRLRIGDALTGFSLDNGTRLTIGWPDEYETATTRPAPTDRRPNAVVWAGTTEFNSNEPLVEVAHSSPTTNSTGSGAGTGRSNGASASGSDLPLPSIGMAVFVLLVGSLGIVWFARRRQTDDTAASATPVANSAEARRETSTESAPTSSDNSNQSPATAAADDRPSLDLLSNEERVVEVLRRSDGRAKQQQIVETLGWTDAKTSSVVSQLRDDGTIEGFRLGRENVLRLPDEETENDTNDTPTDK